MKDELISRQAAVDALGEEPPVWYDGEDELAERDQWRRDVNAIKALPSVQPRNACIVEVKAEIDVDEIKDYIDKAINADRWIPCSERLPEEDGDYLVTFESGEMRTASKEGINQNRFDGMLAWMPLPEPYKADGED